MIKEQRREGKKKGNSYDGLGHLSLPLNLIFFLDSV